VARVSSRTSSVWARWLNIVAMASSTAKMAMVRPMARSPDSLAFSAFSAHSCASILSPFKPGLCPDGENPRASLLPQPPLHQLADGVTRRAALFEDCVHLFDDGHLNAMPARQRERGRGSAHAFGDHARCAQDICQPAALAQLHAHGA